jgi:hypothetical protein
MAVDLLFYRGGELGSALEAQSRKLVDEIEAAPEDHLLHVDEDEWVRALVDRWQVEAPAGRRRVFTHAECGTDVDATGLCPACRTVPGPGELVVRPGPGSDDDEPEAQPDVGDGSSRTPDDVAGWPRTTCAGEVAEASGKSRRSRWASSSQRRTPSGVAEHEARARSRGRGRRPAGHGVGREFVRKTGSGGGRVGRRRLEGPVGGSVAQRVG